MSLVWSSQPYRDRRPVRLSVATMRTLAQWYARFYWYIGRDLVFAYAAIALWLVAWATALGVRC